MHAIDYFYPGTFNKERFREIFRNEFRGDPRYTDDALASLVELVALMEDDEHVLDIRWMAYMLATVFWETAQPVRQQVRVLSKKGIPLKDKKGHPVVRSVKRWAITMKPVAEVGGGAGRPYYLPVKVKKLEDGGASVTEQDGDRYLVSASGTVIKKTPNKPGTRVTLGAPAKGEPKDKYEEDDGEELCFFGRGYVQLTWWSNYASAGGWINKGLELLFDPDRVREPDIAYQVMAYGMRTGKGFANGHSFKKYFHGPITDYVGARSMVNPGDHARDIALIAQRAESALFMAKSSLC